MRPPEASVEVSVVEAGVLRHLASSPPGAGDGGCDLETSLPATVRLEARASGASTIWSFPFERPGVKRVDLGGRSLRLDLRLNGVLPEGPAVLRLARLRVDDGGVLAEVPLLSGLAQAVVLPAGDWLWTLAGETFEGLVVGVARSSGMSDSLLLSLSWTCERVPVAEMPFAGGGKVELLATSGVDLTGALPASGRIFSYPTPSGEWVLVSPTDEFRVLDSFDPAGNSGRGFQKSQQAQGDDR